MFSWGGEATLQSALQSPSARVPLLRRLCLHHHKSSQNELGKVASSKEGIQPILHQLTTKWTQRVLLFAQARSAGLTTTDMRARQEYARTQSLQAHSARARPFIAQCCYFLSQCQILLL
mmetsp:Transcript_26611/g.61153  ORF Transcript_26611/g.61153 Transcript_26611/m.61153 type:complete len:119 (+) Transcript_26611:79-435(+)